MLSIPEKNEPFVSKSLVDVLNQITAHVPKEFFHYLRTMSWEDAKAFDHEMIQFIEKAKLFAAQEAGIKTLVQYFRVGRSCVLLSTDPYIFGNEPYQGDIRKTPLDIDGYRVSCNWSEDKGAYDTNVSISPGYLEMYRTTVMRMAAKYSVAEAADAFQSLGKVPSAEVFAEVERLFLAVNEKRKAAGLELVSRTEAGLPEALVLPMRPN